ncbi:MAG: efflux RND transporter periplasmic adaptor subunit [Victivallaceae bacterium]
MSNKFSFTLFAVLTGATLLAALTGCKEEEKQSAANETKSIKVTLKNLEKARFQQKIRAQGVVKAKDTATIPARIEGIVEKIPFDEGDYVKKGDLLFEIDRTNLKNRVEICKQEIAVAETELKTAEINLELADSTKEKARIDFERAKKLQANNAISQDAYESRGLDFHQAVTAYNRTKSLIDHYKAKLEQAKTNLVIAEKNLADSIQVSPIDGVICKRDKDPGEYTKSGTDILYIENPDNMEFSTYISELYYDSIKPGQTKAIILKNGKPIQEFLITYRAPTIDPISRTFEVKGVVKNDKELISGTMREVDIVLNERDGFGLNADAVLIQSDNRYIIFENDNGIARAITVKPGITDRNLTEILDGDKLADKQFVVSGQAFISDQSKITDK